MNIDLSVQKDAEWEKGDLVRIDPTNADDVDVGKAARDDGYAYGIVGSSSPDPDSDVWVYLADGGRGVVGALAPADDIDVVWKHDEVP